MEKPAPDLGKLKAEAYDLIAIKEQVQRDLDRKNAEIIALVKGDNQALEE